MEPEELELLEKKMKEAIQYQFYFGTKEEDKIERAAKNCTAIANSFFKKKLQNKLDKN